MSNSKILYDSTFDHRLRRPMSQTQDDAGQPFKLLRLFSLASLVLIAAFAGGNAFLISSFLSKHMLEREGEVTRDFVQNILITDNSIGYLAEPGNAELRQRFRDSVQHFVATRDILRTNVYLPDGTVLWSSDQAMVGRKFADNHELEEALEGRLVVESGRITSELRNKQEHVGLPADSEFFVETYIPLALAEGGKVIGVVEIYKAPVALTAAIRAGHRQVWAAAGLGAVILYLTLFWIVHRADRLIRRQHERLIEAETMAAVGELTSAMAHNIRNPLASIRSSAELSLELHGESAGVEARDIIKAVDRVESWMRELLRFTRTDAGTRAHVDVGAVLRASFEETAREFERRGVDGKVVSDTPGAMVGADPAVLAHLLHSLISNALDATPAGGRVEGRIERAGGKRVAASIRDTGRGISAADLENVFRPFFTTKKEGLGLGLTLVRRTVERMGGEIRIDSTPGEGTTVTLELPAA
jgi:signal transduction histidine kinase